MCFKYFGPRTRLPSAHRPIRVMALIATSLLLCIQPAISDTPPAPGPAALVDVTTVPGGLMFMPVLLTGAQGQQVDATFLLDTGASSCQVSAALAQKLGLMPKSSFGSGGKQTVADQPTMGVVVPGLSFGGLSSPNTPMYVLNDKEASGLSTVLGVTVDGVIGGNLLTAAPTVYDFQRRQVGFFAHSPVTDADLQACSMQGALVVPLRDLAPGDGRVTCRVGLSDGAKTDEEDLVIDTGTNQTSLPLPAAKLLGLTNHGKRDRLYQLGGYSQVYDADLPTLILGDLPPSPGSSSGGASSTSALTVRGLTVLYPKGAWPDYAPPAVGVDVLSHFRVLLDYGARKMYLLPLTPPPAPQTFPAAQPPTPQPAPAK